MRLLDECDKIVELTRRGPICRGIRCEYNDKGERVMRTVYTLPLFNNVNYPSKEAALDAVRMSQ